MTEKLPPNLLRLFVPRPPLPFAPPLDRPPEKRRGPQLSGISAFISVLLNKEHDQDYVPTETLEEKRKRKLDERNAKHEKALKTGLEEYDPTQDKNATADPFKTIFIARMSYDVTEADLRAEFERYGPVTTARIVKDRNEGKSRGYAFVEFERERDMKAAYKEADGTKILGRRVMVDVERGRTVKGWRPRRLGGGLGGTRVGAPDVNQRYSGRELPAGQRPPPEAFGGPMPDRPLGPPPRAGGYGPPPPRGPRDSGPGPRDFRGPPMGGPPPRGGYDRGPPPPRSGGYHRGPPGPPPREYDRAPPPEEGFPRGPPPFGAETEPVADRDGDVDMTSARSQSRHRHSVSPPPGGFKEEYRSSRRGSRSRSPRRDRERDRRDDRDRRGRDRDYRRDRERESSRW